MHDHERLTRDDWMRAARRALLTGGAEAVRVEPLAAALGVTKGSFYWHFRDRAALLEALLAEWEDELNDARVALDGAAGPDAVRRLLDFIAPRVERSERGELPADAAILAWAATDRRVAARVRVAEAQRVALVQRAVGDDAVGEFLYLAYIGFVTRRRRTPSTAAFFPTFADVAASIAVSIRAPRTKSAVARSSRRASP